MNLEQSEKVCRFKELLNDIEEKKSYNFLYLIVADSIPCANVLDKTEYEKKFNFFILC